MKKKLVPMLLIVVIVFNFIVGTVSYADKDDERLNDLSRYGGNETIKGEAVQSLSENGTDSKGNTMEHTNFGGSLIGVLLQIIASIVDSFPMTVQSILSGLTTNPTNSGELGFVKTIIGLDLENHFTIERTVFNEIAIFNIDVFNQDESFTNGSGSHTETIYQNYRNL